MPCRLHKANNATAQEPPQSADDGVRHSGTHKPTADNADLERWIRENIPLDVLSGDAPTESLDPSGPLLRAHLSAKTSWQQRQHPEQKGSTSSTPPPPGKSLLHKNPFKDYKYLGMEHPEVWVPSGSGPSSFHRQQLIEAKSALLTLKASASLRIASSGSSPGRSPLQPGITPRERWPKPVVSTQPVHSSPSSPTVSAARMVPIPDSMPPSTSSSHSDGDNDDDGSNSDSFDDLADPELVRIRKGVRVLEKTGSYPSTDVSHTYSRYVQSWESSPDSPRGVRQPPQSGGFVMGVRPLQVPDDLGQAPKFLQRAMNVAQEAHFIRARQAAQKSREGDGLNGAAQI